MDQHTETGILAPGSGIAVPNCVVASHKCLLRSNEIRLTGSSVGRRASPAPTNRGIEASLAHERVVIRGRVVCGC
jgi:hypothetical protein